MDTWGNWRGSRLRGRGSRRVRGTRVVAGADHSGRLRAAIERINPKLPPSAVEEAVQAVLSAEVAGCPG